MRDPQFVSVDEVGADGDGDVGGEPRGLGGRRPDVTAAPEAEPLISIRDVSVEFAGRGRRAQAVRALDHVSLDVGHGQTVGIVGESGSGKTTLGRVMLGLIRPAEGTVLFDGLPLRGPGAFRRLKGRLQVVLQNPDWSLNPALRVWRSLAEPLAVTGAARREDRRAAAMEMLTLVGLDESFADRRPHELSGGQRQRVAIARAMITSPDLIVFDEAVTALDASVQTQVLNLIHDLQAERGFSAVFISHDLAAVRYISSHIAVALRGEIVEFGPVERFYGRADHPYTRQLLSTLPVPHRDRPVGGTTPGHDAGKETEL
ncbi:ABC transporter ATP-binding protein [Kribbella sp. NPDC051620]|uniref:ABC transporter ATP-binding protein n=1 Tax=Kribbella sp. NPDC051620 TaxID=3364120 RepID=UPI0037990379